MKRKGKILNFFFRRIEIKEPVVVVTVQFKVVLKELLEKLNLPPVGYACENLVRIMLYILLRKFYVKIIVANMRCVDTRRIPRKKLRIKLPSVQYIIRSGSTMW